MRRTLRTKAKRDDETDFSLVLGGPLYQLLIRTRLARPPLELLARRLIVIPAVAWLPLLALTLYEGTAIGGVAVPFLKDVEVYARFFVGLPLLLVAEPLVHARIRPLVRQFIDNDLIREDARSRFHTILERSTRLRSSMAVELSLIALVFLIGPWSRRYGLALDADTWFSIGGETTLAGHWSSWVSAPIFQFLLLRWLFRLALWWRFLWRVSRLPLALHPMHPDRAGGLGFLNRSMPAFLPVLLAQSAVVSGLILGRVLAGVGTAAQYRPEIAATVVMLVLSIAGPLLFFSMPLLAAKRDAMSRFSVLANRYARDFDHKWMRPDAPAGEPPLGSADIQSMADLDGSFAIVRGMRPVPFDLRFLVALAVVTASPFFPLVLTVVPLEELLKRVAGMLL